jgi:hypothetical protein
MKYEDFVLQIGPDTGGGYSVNVVKSPAGEGTGVFRPPFNGSELGQVIQGLGRSLSRSHTQAASEDRHVAIESAGEEESFAPRDVGEALFRSLFTGKVRSLYDQSVGSTAAKPGCGLRIQLKLNPEHPDLARLYSLPWELLYRPDTQDFLSLSRMSPVVRYLDVSRPTSPWPLPSPLRILVVIASPKGLPALNLQREKKNIEAAWGRHKEVEVVFLPEATPGAIREELLDNQFHVLHFMGHGGFDPRSGEGVLFFAGPNGASLPVSGQALASKLKDFRSLRLVFLNACDTARTSGDKAVNPFAGVASALVLGGMPAVLAMQFPISDVAAISFSKAFYQRLAAGDPVDTAVAEGRQAVHSTDPGSVEWATPVLFLRTPDGTLFTRTQPPKAAQGAPGALLKPGGSLLGATHAARTSPWRKVVVAAVLIAGLLTVGVVGAKIAFRDSPGGAPLANDAAESQRAGQETPASRVEPNPSASAPIMPAVIKRAEPKPATVFEVNQEFRSSKEGLTGTVSKVELRGDRMRWYFQFFNRSDDDVRLGIDYKSTYIANEKGDRFPVVEAENAFDLREQYEWLVQKGVRLDRWIDFPLPQNTAQNFTVGLVGGHSYYSPAFDTFEVALPH